MGDLMVPQYTKEQVKSCAKCFNQLAHLIQKSKLQNIVKKFKTSKFFEVARIINNQSGHGGGKRHQSFQSLPSNGKTAREGKDAKSGITATGTASSSHTKQSGGSRKKEQSGQKPRTISQPAANHRASRISRDHQNSITASATTPNTAQTH